MVALKAWVKRRNSPAGEGLRLFASCVVAAGLTLGALQAQAAPATPGDRGDAKVTREKVTALAAKDPETTSSIQSDADANCSRSRKRLWVEGEGWIVRRVTTCY